MTQYNKSFAILLGLLVLFIQDVNGQRLPKLKVSENGRFLVTEDGLPFFWLGDTSWSLFTKSSKTKTEDQPEVELYFRTRAEQGFTVIQTNLGAGGEKSKESWQYADYLLELGEKHGLYFALLPFWGNSIADDHPFYLNPGKAYQFGNNLGQRYRDKTNIIWLMGGDPYSPGKDSDNPRRLVMTRAIAEGIADGINGESSFDGYADFSTVLMSFHPQGRGHSTSYYLHGEPWLDFNMIQSSTFFNIYNYETIKNDYKLWPRKPTMESEAAYEYSLSLYEYETKDRRISPWHSRKAAYWGVFAGGFGHTYGHRSFIHWIRKGEKGSNGADVPWFESLDAEGATDMQHLRKLMESRPFLTRIPDQTLISEPQGNTTERIQATRDMECTYAFFYSPMGKPVSVTLDIFSDNFIRAAWYNPRSGSYEKVRPEKFPANGVRTFYTPSQGEGNDWVLVIDAVRCNYSLP